MHPDIRKEIEMLLCEVFAAWPTLEAQEVASPIGHGNERLYITLSITGAGGVLLRLNALTQQEAKGKDWDPTEDEAFGAAITMISDLMAKGKLAFHTAEEDIEALPPRRGKYLSSARFSEAVWIDQLERQDSAAGMLAASQEEILLHPEDMPHLQKITGL